MTKILSLLPIFFLLSSFISISLPMGSCLTVEQSVDNDTSSSKSSPLSTSSTTTEENSPLSSLNPLEGVQTVLDLLLDAGSTVAANPTPSDSSLPSLFTPSVLPSLSSTVLLPSISPPSYHIDEAIATAVADSDDSAPSPLLTSRHWDSTKEERAIGSASGSSPMSGQQFSLYRGFSSSSSFSPMSVLLGRGGVTSRNSSSRTTPPDSSSSSSSLLGGLGNATLLMDLLGIPKDLTTAGKEGGGGEGREATKEDAEVELKTCEAGKTFSIRSEEDLLALAKEGLEECVYAAAVAPVKPPVGFYYGGVLKVFDTDIFNDAVRDLWAGKIGFKTQCKHKDSAFYMLQNLFNNGLSLPALMYIGNLADAVNPLEYDDGGAHLFIDYTPDMAKVCPVSVESRYNMNFGVINNNFPASQLIDVVRLVGRTDDGGYILLGKTFLRNMMRFPNEGDRTAAFWYVVCYDDEAFPEIGDTIGPTPNTFRYSHYKLHEVLSTYIDFRSFLVNPTESLVQITDYLFRWPMGLPLLGENSRESQRLFPLSGVPSPLEPTTSQQALPAVGLPGGIGGGSRQGHVANIPGRYTFSGRVFVPEEIGGEAGSSQASVK